MRRHDFSFLILQGTIALCFIILFLKIADVAADLFADVLR